MNILRLTALAALLSFCAIAQTKTTVTGTLVTPTGDRISGSCDFQISGPYTIGSSRVAQPKVTVEFTAGALSVALLPTDTGSPVGRYYSVTCSSPAQTVNGRKILPYNWPVKMWLVPTSAIALDISLVETTIAPSTIVSTIGTTSVDSADGITTPVLRLNPGSLTKPTCAVGQRGKFWVTSSSGGTQDIVEVCTKQADDSYAWASSIIEPTSAAVLGDLPYRSATGWTRLAGNTVAAKRLLCQTGTGSASAAPTWCALVAGDIPDISATYSTKTAGGDLSGTLPSPTVAKINGTSVPTNSAADQFLGTSASATAAWVSVGNCVAAGGVLQYATSTHTFSCHTLASADIPNNAANTSGTATTATNLGGGTSGQYPYQTGSGATSFRSPNVANGPVVLDSSANASMPGTLTTTGYIYAPGHLSALGYGGCLYTDAASAGNGVNTRCGYSGNVIDTANGGYIVATISGGGSATMENKLLCTLGTHCSYSSIGGGYDNQMDSAYPSTISGGAHNRVNMATSNTDLAHTWTYQNTGYTPNSSTDHSSIAGGTYNAIYNAEYAAIGGGTQNALGFTSTSNNAVIGGGITNKADGNNVVVAGGQLNIANGNGVVLSGGYGNTATGQYITVSGGGTNAVVGDGSTVSGGSFGAIGIVATPTTFAHIGGGVHNTIGSTAASGNSVIAGGDTNTVNGTNGFIGGGTTNAITGTAHTIAGGKLNAITGTNAAAIGGGESNSVASDYSTVAGGFQNSIASSSRFSFAGGRASAVTGEYAFAYGRQAKTSANGAWSLADQTASDSLNSVADSMLFRFAGGYRFTGGATTVASLVNSGASSLAGHVTFASDNTYDIGASGATRPRDFYLGRNALIAGTLGVTGLITGSISGNAGTVTNGVYTSGSYADPAWITSLAASKVGLGSVENTALSTWAGTTNLTTLGTLVTFGGATSSFPALKRSSTALQVRLADDSGYAPLSTGAITVNGADITTANSLGYKGTRTDAVTAAMLYMGPDDYTTVKSSGSSFGVKIANTAGTALATMTNGGVLSVPGFVATPASASAACTAGTIAFDASFAYFCTATNTWKRVAIATW